MKRLSKFTAIALLLLTASACSTTQPQVPANLKAECKLPVKLQNGANMGDLLEASVENNYRLVECYERHRALSAAMP